MDEKSINGNTTTTKLNRVLVVKF